MRRTAFAVVAVAVGLIIQLTILNGLHLPGGGVPDLVLVLVAALGIASGPVRGTITGFAAGLVLDLAPPGSAVLGEYALVCCLIGWAAGALSRVAARSALRSLVVMAAAVAVGEAMIAGLDLGLDPAQVSLRQVRHVLPYSVAYDLILTPFVLLAALAASTWASRQRVDPLEAAGVPAAESALALGTRHPAPRRPREPRVGPGSARPHDGWVGSKPAGLGGQPRPALRPGGPHRLRAAGGVAGSAFTAATSTGPPRHPGLAAPSVRLRLATGRRGDGAVGNPVGASIGSHPGLRSPRRRTASFRPHGGVPGGSAAGQYASMVRPGPSGPGGRRAVPLRFSGRRKDATVGRLLGVQAPAADGLRETFLAGRGTRAIQFGRTRGPRFRPGSSAARSRRKAAPRFKRASAAGSAVAAAGLMSSGKLDQATVMAARRRQAGAPRLRLRARRGDGALAGSVLQGSALRRRPLHRPATPRFRTRPAGRPDHGGGRRQPRFGYGRRSLLAFLAGHRIGGAWLARTRAGTRAGASVIRRKEGMR